MEVDAVEQRTGDASAVGPLLVRRAPAPPRAWPAAARAGVHGRDELEPRGEAERAARAGDGDAAFLERLPQHLEDVASELGDLVEEEHAVVGEAHLAGSRHGPAADERDVARRVVGRA